MHERACQCWLVDRLQIAEEILKEHDLNGRFFTKFYRLTGLLLCKIIGLNLSTALNSGYKSIIDFNFLACGYLVETFALINQSRIQLLSQMMWFEAIPVLDVDLLAVKVRLSIVQRSHSSLLRFSPDFFASAIIWLNRLANWQRSVN